MSTGLSVHCLLVEMLPDGTDVGLLKWKTIRPLPAVVYQALGAGTADYMVDYGVTKRALQRTIRCAAGRYIVLLREGDELSGPSGTSTETILPENYDVLIGVPLPQFEYCRQAHRSLAGNGHGLRALPALIAVGAVYDGALLVARDYLDDVLGSVGYDATYCYVGYINEIVSVALLRKSGRVGFTDQLGCTPTPVNLLAHVERTAQHTLGSIESRFNDDPGEVEDLSRALIVDALKLARVQLQGGTSPQEASSYSPYREASPLGQATSGNLPGIVRAMMELITIDVGVLLSGEARRSSHTGQPSTTRRALRQEAPIVTIISSLFRGHQLIHSFLADVVRQSIFYDAELVVVLPERSMVQDAVCKIFALSDARVILVPLERDPGIYGCWNVAIRWARGRFITNANLDDRRDRYHLQYVIETLESSGADVGSAPIMVSHSEVEISTFDGEVDALLRDGDREIWFGSKSGDVEFKGLLDFFVFDANGQVVQCMNFPHCMPVWRREIHDRIGYFDESTNGTYADFALWLRAAKEGARFAHLSQCLGLYYVDPDSHSRRNANENAWMELVGRYLPPNTAIRPPLHVAVANPNSCQVVSHRSTPRFNFGTQSEQKFGRHRSGWLYAMSGLAKFHDPESPIYCEPFIEKKFVWGCGEGEGGGGPVRPHVQPWIGFIHVPPLVPAWFQSEQSNQRVFTRKPWRTSLKHCRGLFTGSIRVSQRHFGAFWGFSWVI